MTRQTEHDVVICGGGLAGLLLARQLQRHQPSRSILIIDKASSRTSETRFKVGESIPEGGAYHLRHAVALEDYLFTRHVPKFGFRFFFGGGDDSPFAQRLEYGGTQWPPFATFQLERSILEDDLRELVQAKGATVLRGCPILDIELLDDGPHRVRFECEGQPRVATGRWVIDATGRRRLLVSKLGLALPTDHHVGASWWHVDGRVDVSSLVDAGDAEWHGRTGPPRWYSTVHLAGHGYWVWIIPLVSGTTSIGITGDERLHPIRARTSVQGVMEWCRRHEPGLARLVHERPVLDFGALKSFTYGTRQAFSPQRWACVGDAAVLSDPLYALGQDLIGHAVTITTKLIEDDFGAGLCEQVVMDYDRMFRTLFDIILDQYRGMYPTFGSPFAYTQKLAWDSSMYFAILQQILMQDAYDDPRTPRMLLDLFERLAPLNQAMQRLFLDCLERDGRMDVFSGMRTWAPRVTQFADASLDKCSPDRLAAFFEERLDHLEGIATAIFGEVLRHSPSIPAEQAERVLARTIGIEPRAVSMEPERWERDGLFDGSRPPIDFEQPAQFDVHNRLQGEQRDFRAVHVQFTASATRHHDQAALVQGTSAWTYGELLAGTQRVAAIANALPTPTVGIRVSEPVRALQAMLGVLAAGRAFALLEPHWDEAQRSFVADRCGLGPILTDDGLAAGLGEPSHAAPLEPAQGSAAVGDIRSQDAFFDVRFTDFGPRAAMVDHGALFRMCRWLPVLMRKGLPESTDLRTLRCLWAGPASPELIAPMLHGLTLVLPDRPDPGGPELLRLLEEHEIDLMLARPATWQALVDAGWPARGLRVVSVRDALPKQLSLLLRARAERVCDFGYATFAH